VGSVNKSAYVLTPVITAKGTLPCYVDIMLVMSFYLSLWRDNPWAETQTPDGGVIETAAPSAPYLLKKVFSDYRFHPDSAHTWHELGTSALLAHVTVLPHAS
jgi:hypothetical protein